MQLNDTRILLLSGKLEFLSILLKCLLHFFFCKNLKVFELRLVVLKLIRIFGLICSSLY